MPVSKGEEQTFYKKMEEFFTRPPVFGLCIMLNGILIAVGLAFKYYWLFGAGLLFLTVSTYNFVRFLLKFNKDRKEFYIKAEEEQ